MEELKDYINIEYVVKNDIYKSLEFSVICIICQNILIHPITCKDCNTSYCKQCIERWNLNNKKCPLYSHENPVYQKNDEICDILSKLQFECKDCKEIYYYKDMINHFYSECGIETRDNSINNVVNPSEYVGIFEKKENEELLLQYEEPSIKLNSK